jgi:hypothetical protein
MSTCAHRHIDVYDVYTQQCVYTHCGHTDETSVDRGAPRRKVFSTIFDIREELLEERWMESVVVASSRERRAPGPDLSSVPMRGSARYRPAKHVRSSRAVSCRGSAASNARINREVRSVRAHARVRDPLRADTRKSDRRTDRQHAVRQAGNYNGTGAGGRYLG